MIALLEELSACFQWDRAGKLIPKINEQGKKDGLSKEQIRELIFSYFKGGLGDRQLRRLLPLELKYRKFANKRKDVAAEADIMSASDDQPGIENLANEPETSTEEHSKATIEIKETTRENMPRTSKTKSAATAAAMAEDNAYKVAAPVVPKEQNAQDIGISPRGDSEVIASLKTENKKLEEKNDYLVRKLEEKSPEFSELHERIMELEGIEQERIRHRDFNSADSIPVKNDLMEEIDTLRKQVAEQTKLLSKDTFEGELEMRGLPVPLIVHINWSTGRATITRK